MKNISKAAIFSISFVFALSAPSVAGMCGGHMSGGISEGGSHEIGHTNGSHGTGPDHNMHHNENMQMMDHTGSQHAPDDGDSKYYEPDDGADGERNGTYEPDDGSDDGRHKHP
jgi:hypothetical protein